MEVAGQAAIVTGGHSGMGFAAAKALVSRGAKVSIVGRRLERVIEKAREIGALGFAGDVSDEASIEACFEAAEKEHGIARILIHAAAQGSMQMLLNPDGSEAPSSIIQEIVQTNVLGTLFVNRAFSSRLTRAESNQDEMRGVIINVSSIGAADGVVGAIYAASKGSVDALGLSLARELSAWKIRVCTIAPGGIDTEMLRGGAVESTYDLIKKHVPGLGRMGKAEEFAALAIQICENDYLNGVNIRLDGGMRLPFSYDVGGGAKRPNV